MCKLRIQIVSRYLLPVTHFPSLYTEAKLLLSHGSLHSLISRQGLNCDTGPPVSFIEVSPWNLSM